MNYVTTFDEIGGPPPHPIYASSAEELVIGLVCLVGLLFLVLKMRDKWFNRTSARTRK
jgi:hypothetical protein